MSALVVQKVVNQTFSGVSSGNVNFAGNVITGNAVIVLVETSGSRGVTASDATNGSYVTDAEQPTTDRFAHICSKRNLTGGFTQVSISISGGVTNFVVSIYEVSGLNNVSPQTGLNSMAGTSVNHICSDTLLSGTGFWAACCALNGSGGGLITPSGTWMLDTPTTGVEQVHMSQVATLNNEQGAFTTAVDISSWGALAFYVESAVAGGFPFITTIGAKRI